MVRKISIERILAERYGDLSEDDAKYKNREARREWRRQYMREYTKRRAAENGSQQ
jgi:hypothetical protein